MKRMALGLALAGLMVVSSVAFAAEKQEIAGIGLLQVPKQVRIESGEQAAIAYHETKSPKLSFARKGIPDAQFYTVTWENGPDFSYGYVLSGTVGAQYLQREGVSGYRDLSLEEQLDKIADTMNREIIKDGAVFEGEMPLVKLTDKKHPRYEGMFTVTKKEKDITYRTAYYMTVQINEIRISVGLIASDADKPELTKALADMMKKRTFPENKNFMRNL